MEWLDTPFAKNIGNLIVGVLIVLVGRKFEKEEKGVISHLAFLMMLFGVYVVMKALLSLLK